RLFRDELLRDPSLNEALATSSFVSCLRHKGRFRRGQLRGSASKLLGGRRRFL
ncbi:unnamed protein product, partial [Laminaria digitata]